MWTEINLRKTFLKKFIHPDRNTKHQQIPGGCLKVLLLGSYAEAGGLGGEPVRRTQTGARRPSSRTATS